MRKFRLHILLLVSVISLSGVMTSCIHEFPSESTPAKVDITLSFNTEMPYFRTLSFPEQTGANQNYTDDPENKPEYFDAIKPDWQTGAENYRIRYVAEAYRVLPSGKASTYPEQRYIGYDDDATVWDDYHFSMVLPEGPYEIRAWADYISKDSDDHLYYDVTTFSGIVLNHKNGHHGNTDFRDAHSGRSRVEVIRYPQHLDPVRTEVQMSRPMGKYVFVTSDLHEFATKVLMNKAVAVDPSKSPVESPDFNIDDYTLTIRCQQWLPTSYSMNTDKANDSQVNVQFKSGLKAIDGHHAIMGFDYVLADGNDKVTKVVLDIILQDKEGTVLASHGGVYVHLKRSKMTLVEGNFLIQESDGGVSIDPGFNGPDIIVPVY